MKNMNCKNHTVHMTRNTARKVGRKILSVLLAFVMTAAIFPGPAWAVDALPAENVDNLPPTEEAMLPPTESAPEEESPDAVSAPVAAESSARLAAADASLAANSPVRLRIETKNNRDIVVKQGGTLSPEDLADLIVYAVYADGSEEQIKEGYFLSGVDTSEPGETEVTVGFDGAEGSFTVKVEEEEQIVGFFISKKPNRFYTKGEELDLTGMQVMMYYNAVNPETGKRKTYNKLLEADQFVATGYNSNQLGVQTVTISYKGKSSEFLVKVSPPKGTPMPDDLPKLMAPRINIEAVRGGKVVRFTRKNNTDSTYANYAAGVMKATIYYTLDGSVPTPGKPGTMEYPTDGSELDQVLYQTPGIEIHETTTVKAVALMGNETSAVTSGRVSVPRVERPMPANPNHRNNQGPGGSVTELESGTLVSLLCDTAGASIYYWFEGHEGDADNSRYGSSIYIDSAYANQNEQVIVRAYAAKDGYQNSEQIRLIYHVPKPVIRSELVNVSVGNVPRGRAGEPLSTSLSITTELSSFVTGFDVTIQYNRRAFEFLSVSPVEGDGESAVIPANEIFSAPDPSKGTVRVFYSGGEVEGGEMLMLNFRAHDSSEDTSEDLKYSLELSDASTVSTTSGRPVETQVYEGVITLIGSVNSQLTASVSFSGSDNQDASNAGDLSGNEQVTAAISLDRESAEEYADSVRSDPENTTLAVIANAFVAFYDDDHMMVALEGWEIDLSDLNYLLFDRLMNMPEDAVEIKTMILSESLTPIMAAAEL